MQNVKRAGVAVAERPDMTVDTLCVPAYHDLTIPICLLPSPFQARGHPINDLAGNETLL